MAHGNSALVIWLISRINNFGKQMLFLHAVHSKSTPVSKVGVMCSLRSRSLLKRTAAERKDPFFPLLPLKTKQNKTSFFFTTKKIWVQNVDGIKVEKLCCQSSGPSVNYWYLPTHSPFSKHFKWPKATPRLRTPWPLRGEVDMDGWSKAIFSLISYIAAAKIKLWWSKWLMQSM